MWIHLNRTQYRKRTLFKHLSTSSSPSKYLVIPQQYSHDIMVILKDEEKLVKRTKRKFELTYAN